MRKYDSDLSKATPEDRAIFDAADGVAEYDKCVAISTQASIKEMVMPGLLAIIVPVFIGFVGGAEMLGGLLAGVPPQVYSWLFFNRTPVVLGIMPRKQSKKKDARGQMLTRQLLLETPWEIRLRTPQALR